MLSLFDFLLQTLLLSKMAFGMGRFLCIFRERESQLHTVVSVLPSAAEGCINETREMEHQALIMPPLPHSAQYWVLLVLKIFPKH